MATFDERVTTLESTVSGLATKADLEASFEDMRGYVDTAVSTLTEEMDQRFNALNTKLDTKFTEVLTAIREHQHGA